MDLPVEITDKLILAHRILALYGAFELNLGHVSFRLDGDDRYLIIGHIHHLGKTFEDIQTEDLTLMDGDGEVIQGRLKPPGERFIHTEIYKARPEIQSVAHAHPHTAVAFSVSGTDLLPVGHRGTIFTPKVPILDDPGQIDSPALGREVARALGQAPALLLAGHGAVTVGGSIEEAVSVMIALEDTANLQATASLVGQPRPIEQKHIEGGTTHGIEFSEFVECTWAAYSARVRKAK
ncbi:MAG: class II aldolase/adducin family protein [Nitrospinota bacterium]